MQTAAQNQKNILDPKGVLARAGAGEPDLGAWVDSLGAKTRAGRWHWFLTMSFRTAGDADMVTVTNEFGEVKYREPLLERGRPVKFPPWANGFPMVKPAPSESVVHEHFSWFVNCFLPASVDEHVEFFVCHQFGELNGRLHLHAALSWPGGESWRWKDASKAVWDRCGMNRILPWGPAAGRYLSRYVTRDIAGRAHWDCRVLSVKPGTRILHPIGRRDVSPSRAPGFRSSGALRSKTFFGR